MVWRLVNRMVKVRNSRTFQNVERFLRKLKSLLICTLFELSGAWAFTLCTFVLEFCENPDS